jgi:hypothetical protein
MHSKKSFATQVMNVIKGGLFILKRLSKTAYLWSGLKNRWALARLFYIYLCIQKKLCNMGMERGIHGFVLRRWAKKSLCDHSKTTDALEYIALYLFIFLKNKSFAIGVLVSWTDSEEYGQGIKLFIIILFKKVSKWL